MGLLSWLLGGGKSVNLPGLGTYEIDVVGESKYQLTLASICGGRTEDGHRKVIQAVLVHEDSNPFDNQAIRVDILGKTVGYLARENARLFRKELKRAGRGGSVAICSAMIVGGWDRGDGDMGHFGVKLDLPTR